MAKCIACYRDASNTNEFCRYHKHAYDALKKNYSLWCNAYGKIAWKEYLERLLDLKETGLWVKEVVILELKEKKRV